MSKLHPILLRLCARYILLEKRRHLALDPVANFHLRNGACAYRLNWLGDTSTKGMEESFGIMINYLYSLDHIEMNNQQYLQDGTISVSAKDPWLRSALKSAPSLSKDISGESTTATTTAASATTLDSSNSNRGGENSNSGGATEGQVVQTHGSRFRLLSITTA
ncbi:hypothetical protein BGW38_008491 [Lunasporangiospora selenospora]|uniref:Malonyl-CoA decarboxylase C-terminal domain-containing protein n=1 Tax=Lunasporangiospora selenospora TaxID=979761 RepID=A0A9P6K9J7_9FUNG|nr:hypothetical protein BGW38_008491 [Lunasporangiospora selenospora]